MRTSISSKHKSIHAAALLIAAGFLWAALGSQTAYGVTAAPGLHTYEQPDGTRISYYLRGDENRNWQETKDGTLIKMDQRTGYYCYAKNVLGHVYRSNARVGIEGKPSFSVAGMGALLSPAFSADSLGSTGAMSIQSAPSLSGSVSVPASQPVLVLVVNFTNISSIAPAGYWEKRFFSDTESSVDSYYKEVSYGKTGMVPVAETAQTANDGVVMVTLAQAHPGTDGYTSDVGSQVPDIVRKALQQADANVDFAPYDQDGNGKISPTELHIAVIFAGGEAATGAYYKSIWAHAWEYSSLSVDGKTISHYIVAGERFGDSYGNPSSTLMTMGVFCHELGHSMGLPDLYDYGYDSVGVGGLSLMASGSWGSGSGQPGASPVHPDAWSKIALGFVSPELGLPGTEYLLNDTGSASFNILKISNPSAPDQYFLLENRMGRGYDAALDEFFNNSGIAIYHVDENVMDYANANPYTFPYFNDNRFRKGVDVEEANFGVLGYGELDYYGSNRSEYINPSPASYKGYTFFALGDTGKYASSFNESTQPSSRFYSNPVGASIIPPLVYDATTGGNWYFETDSSVGIQALDSGISLDILDVAQDTMRVLYNAASYTVSLGVSPAAGGTATGGGSYGPGAAITLQAAPKSGYTFTGWWEGSTLLGTENPLVMEASRNMELTAAFRANNYTIKFSGNGATSGTMGSLAMTYDASKTLTTNAFKKTGYAFLGWATSSTGPVVYKNSASVKNLTATANGTVTLYAKWGAPVVSAVSSGYTSIKVSWAYAGSATSYKIYRATSATGTYSLVYTASSSARSWVNTGRVTGKTYYYKVYPVAGGKTYKFSTYKSAKAVPSTPTASLTKPSSTSIKVSWTGVSGATKYQVYRATSATGTYSLVYTASSSARSWTNSSLTKGKTYYYKVRAYHLEGTTKVYGGFSSVKYLKI